MHVSVTGVRGADDAATACVRGSPCQFGSPLHLRGVDGGLERLPPALVQLRVDGSGLPRAIEDRIIGEGVAALSVRAARQRGWIIELEIIPGKPCMC